MNTNSLIALGTGVLFLIGTTAGEGLYIMESRPDETSYKSSSAKDSEFEIITYSQAQPPPFPECGDDSVVGKVVGGVSGVSLLGEEYIPIKNVTCK